MSFAHVFSFACIVVFSTFLPWSLIIFYLPSSFFFALYFSSVSFSLTAHPSSPFYFYLSTALTANLAEKRSNVAALLSTPGSSNPCLLPSVPDFVRDTTLSCRVLICPLAITKAKIRFYGAMFYSGATCNLFIFCFTLLLFKHLLFCFMD